ncbi:hypothetical protein BUALT_Bualt19G0098700 [Buddleja alternifolia]|uniref:KIB1-4 beta-propeller domain-containing protein n=1 Tax=Buddleja alternifolia TaxID=168488 RepID=A0AAV6WB71_9LAMI|nr:hypothetical protein BUALT_Bualt19G0098700 [Buddleja alternifolia]
MSSKTTKKKNHLPSAKQSTPSPNSWPNLPHHLIALIARQPNLMQNITSFGGVTKSWRSPSRQCSPNGKARWPRLVEINGKDHTKSPRSHVCEIKFHEEYPYCYYRRRDWYNVRYPDLHFKGHSHGMIVVMEPASSNSYLWEPARRSTRYLPPWYHNLPFKFSTLSSFPDDRNGCNALVLTGLSTPAFAFYELYGEKREWTLENCTIKDPYSPNQNMQFSNAIGFKGKFYALSLQGSLVVIEDIDSCLRITGIGSGRAVPSKVSRQFREYLVESNGEILLVFLVSRKCIDLVEDVEVFRLDIDKLLWVKVESLGDWTLFLEDECCMGIDSRKVGCKKNCVYFTHHRVDNWWVFEMENGKISQAFGNDNEMKGSVMWDEPKEME